MPAPSLSGVLTGSGDTATSHAVSLSAGTSDKLIVLGFEGDAGTVAATGWTVAKQLTDTSGTLAVLTRAATSDTSVSVSTTNSVQSGWISALTDGDITNAVLSTGVIGSGTAPDADAVAVSSGDYRVVVAEIHNPGTRTVTAYPVGYVDDQTYENTSFGPGPEPAAVICSQGLTGITSEDPGAFTLSSNASWATVTIAIPAAAGAGTFTGSAAVTLADHTSTASGTFTPPTFTGSAAPTLADHTSTASGTFSSPDVTGSGSPTLADHTSTASGTFTGGTFTGSGAVTLEDYASTATGSFDAPAFTGSASPTLADFTSAGSGTFDVPVYTATAAVTLGDHTSTAVGDLTNPEVDHGGQPGTAPTQPSGATAPSTSDPLRAVLITTGQSTAVPNSGRSTAVTEQSGSDA